MNFGIINNRRPDPRKRGGASVNALLADPRMREIAQQMGLQPQDFGEEAQALWNTLNDLSASDPKRYESFINEQLQDGPPPPPADSSSAQATNDATPPRFFTPDPGFVVKCTMYHSIKSQQKETKLFLNICAHNLIDAPKNPNSGLEVPEDTRAVPNTSSLQVPLVVGKLREVTDFSGALCCAVDVVVNPWVLRRSEWDANFKREVMKLAVQWVQEDAKVRLITPTGKFIKARYKGGVTVGSEIITSKFRIEDADPTKQRMESPADLLKQIHLDEDKEDEEVQELAITPAKGIKATQKPAVLLKAPTLEDAKPPPAPVKGTAKKKAEKKVLIEEVPPPSSKQKTAPSSQSMKNTTAKAEVTQRSKKSGAVKRGFLNSTKSELYPEGSGEGRPSSAYVNLLSRSKIVDLGEMEQQRRAQQDERKETLAFLEPTEKAKVTQKRAASSAESQEVDCGDHFFEQLCEQAEPDLKPITRDGPHSQTMSGDQLFGEGFEEFAKLLTP
ncbi:PIH1 N-terminal domain [Phytophthora infestans]|uniref:PIH1 N-terminal domain n=1 Tax=Phytophthora infestans TaxID=4787 RepID=A0A833WP07_PHYIN|nr:PIH1 N-terminal domain [Phytophthora infestans]KAF4135986.1 PIH1 N-terminal domain [Phytophthora infestans]KAF4144870.1 PIH1 N-terminal domain [Phytophthora infestans]